MLEITSKCICIVRSNKEFIKRAALLPVIKWLLQQGSVLSVVWEKEDDIFCDEFQCEIKVKKRRTRDFYQKKIKITYTYNIEVTEYVKKKTGFTNIVSILHWKDENYWKREMFASAQEGVIWY